MQSNNVVTFGAFKKPMKPIHEIKFAREDLTHNPAFYWDENNVRYQLANSNENGDYNWLFVPGGPGGDSSYYTGLVKSLNLPGKCWLIDFPQNGSNIVDSADYNFDQWLDLYLKVIEKFNNPIYVGHSFGAMIPLFFPQSEDILKGLVILNGAPSLWFAESAQKAKEKHRPDLTKPMQEFVGNPSEKTFAGALEACLPYYFPPESLEQGGALLKDLPFNYKAALWGQLMMSTQGFDAKWIPQQTPTLILGGSEDCITPFSLFEKDQRFHRKNILTKEVQNAGHIPWLEDTEAVRQAFNNFIRMIPSPKVSAKP